MNIDKDMEIYLGRDGESYKFERVPVTVRNRMWNLLEPYRVKDEEVKLEKLISDAAKAEEIFHVDDLESFANSKREDK